MSFDVVDWQGSVSKNVCIFELENCDVHDAVTTAELASAAKGESKKISKQQRKEVAMLGARGETALNISKSMSRTGCAHGNQEPALSCKQITSMKTASTRGARNSLLGTRGGAGGNDYELVLKFAESLVAGTIAGMYCIRIPPQPQHSVIVWCFFFGLFLPAFKFLPAFN